MPGGEFFYSPLEDSASGTIAFTEFPAVYAGREVTGIRLRFEEGRVVDASADAHEDFLVEMLDRDEGSRRLGELGIVIPFSRSRSIESITRSATSWPLRNAPVCHSIASTSVVLPWSTWAMIAMFLRSSLVCISIPRDWPG